MSKIKGRNKEQERCQKKSVVGNKRVKKNASEVLEIFALLILIWIFKKNHDFLWAKPQYKPIKSLVIHLKVTKDNYTWEEMQNFGILLAGC